MGNVKILDCTLRDGGYINDWKFGENVIKDIIKNLIEAKIDIIECGFIRDVAYCKDSSVFSNMDAFSDLVYPKNPNALYAIMIEQLKYKADLIPPCSDRTADLIRFTFRRNGWEQAKCAIRELMDKGYKVCVQPVGTVTYDDPTLIKLLKDVNELKPYAFYIVDTLGMMYRHDMRHFFYLVDNNLSRNIALGLHSHNNLQMSFANAQEMIRLNRDRTIFIDSSGYGMGRGVGNLATELLADYVNNNIEQRYSLTPILNIIDKYLMPIYAEQRWGYDLPFFFSAVVKCHPNYAAHLLRKETLNIEKIEKLLSLIPIESRNEYNNSLIEKLYLDMQACTVDDYDVLERLKCIIGGKNVLIMGAGLTIKTFKDKIETARKEFNLYTITANFISKELNVNALFISNEKRLSVIKDKIDEVDTIIASSNLKEVISRDAYLVDYSSLLGEGDSSDNAGAMLIRLLKKIGVSKLYLAGFDGFGADSSTNYFFNKYKSALDYDTAAKKNMDISKQLKLALSGVEYEILTPTKYGI